MMIRSSKTSLIFLLYVLSVFIISIFFTEGTTRISPSRLILIGTGLLTILAIVLQESSIPRKWRNWTLILGLVAVSVYGCHIFLRPGFPVTHDQAFNYFPGMNIIKVLASRGIIFPRWVHEIWCGVPFGRFYSPVFFFFSTITFWLDPIQTIRILHLSSFFLSGLAMYWVSKSMFERDTPAFGAAVCYILFGYHLLNSNVRGDTVELIAYIWIPLLFFSWLNIYREDERRLSIPWAIICSVLVFLTVVSHLLIGFLVVVWLCSYLVWDIVGHRQAILRRFTARLSSILIGIGLSSWFLMPAILDKSFFELSTLNQGYFSITNHFISLSQFFVRRTWHEWWIASPGWPMYLGNVSLAVSLCSIPFLLHNQYRTKRTGVSFLILTTLGSILLTSKFLLPLGQWIVNSQNPFLKIVTYLQFPWRILEITGFSSSLLVAYTLSNIQESIERKSLRPRVEKSFVIVFVVILVLVDMFPYTGAVAYSNPYADHSLLQAVDWISKEEGLFRVYFSGDERENLYWSVCASGRLLHVMPRGGTFQEWNPTDSFVHLIKRARDELNDGRRLSIAGYLSVKYIVADEKEYRGWLDTDSVKPVGRYGHIVIFENRLFKPYAEVTSNLYDRSAPVVNSDIMIRAFGEEEMIFDVTTSRTGVSYLTIKESYFTPWMAFVDGAEVPVKKTKNGLIAVPISTGSHQVRLVFGQTKSEIIGGLTSAFALAVVLYLSYKHRREFGEILRKTLPPHREGNLR